MGLLDLTAVELGQKIKTGEVKVVDAINCVYGKIEQVEKDINSFITICDKTDILKKAEKIQKKIDAGELTSTLAGVPIAVKDNICTENVRTTCGSKMLENFIPQYSAEVIERLEKAGVIIIGKTNMDEFGMGSTTETSYWGPTKNPINNKYVPGGSSGGSCAAVRSGECFGSLGTDTGGSIRQPSSYCGVVGIKPTYGMVSRYGLVAYGSSLEQIGPIGRDVADCVAILEIIAGHDDKDSTSTNRFGHNFSSALVDDVQGLKIGIPKSYYNEGVDEEIKHSVLKAIEVLKDRGAIVEEFDLELMEYAVPAYYVIASAEASSNLARYDGVKYGYRSGDYQGLHDMYKKTRTEAFGDETKRRIMLGAFVLSEGYYDDYYLKALRTKNLIKQELDKAFEKYDVLISPVTPNITPKLGENLNEPIKMYLNDMFTVSVNLCGNPAASIPCGVSKEGLPIGMQIIGDCFKEHNVIRVAYTYERTKQSK